MRDFDARTPRDLDAIEAFLVADFDFLSVNDHDGHEKIDPFLAVF
jgi:hypothetical protein